MIRAMAEGGGAGRRGPTSVQGKFMAKNGTYLGRSGIVGRPAGATYVRPRGRRA